MTSEARTDRVQRDPERLYEVSEWRVSRVGDLVQIINGYPFDSAGFSSEGWPLIRIRDLNKEVTETHFNGPAVAAATVTRDDVLVGMDGDFNVGRWKSTEPAMLNQRMLALRGPRDLLTVLEYALERPLREINDTTYATTVKHLSSGQVRAIRVRLPSNPKDISALAVFLDRETGEIDAFIRDQEELIGLLQERRAATISHAVIKGLDPNVPTKNSGVPWLGRVPKHWSVTRLSRFFSITLGKMLDAGKEAANDATVLPYIRAANIQETKLDLTSFNEMAFTVAEQRLFSLQRGDLLVVEGGAIGVNQWICEDMPGWAFQKTVNRARSRGRADSRFLGFALDSLRYSGVVDMIANKSTIAHLTAEKLERLVMAWPPPAEQLVIVERLERDLIELDDSIEDARSSIALSTERRSALISAAVTGKIDVRESAGV